MKLISFEHQGRATYGAVVGNNVWDLGQALGAQAPDLKSLIANKLQAAAAQVVASQPSTLKFDQLTLLPVVPNPGKILCIGLNYGEHVRETGKTIT